MTSTTASRPGDRQRVARQPGLAQPAVAGHRVGVEELRDAIGIDDRDEPIEQRDEVEDEDRAQQERAEQQPDELDPVHAQHEAGDQGDAAGSARRANPRARIGRARVEVAEAREEERQERRSERRPGARSRFLRFLHRG